MSEFDNKINDYYSELKTELYDSRDNRGKKHDLALVVLLFMYALLRTSNSLNYSMIHREMCREAHYTQRKLGLPTLKCISYTQFKRLLLFINYKKFNLINIEFFGKTIEKDDRKWKSIDGKELRGTIDKISGQKRSENLIQIVSHQTKENTVIDFYNGSKESEKTVVKNFFKEQTNLIGEAYTLDALHTDAPLLSDINQQQGVYLVQVKGNQKNLLEDCAHLHQNQEEKYKFSSLDKGHGRLEKREGFLFPINIESLDDRWKDTGIQILIAVQRERTILKTNKTSNETVYFISNLSLNPQTGEELFKAVRNHWSVEADHYIRDVTFGEDKIACLQKNTPRVMAIAIGTILNLLRRKNTSNNLREVRENLSKNRRLANQCFSGK